MILDTAGLASPSDYTANNNATYLEDDTLAASDFDESNPPAGFIFCSAAQGYLPQLTVVAPSDKNAFVKLRNSETGETELSFYIRAGYTVKACVPATRCEFSYGLGNTWYGTEEAFGSDGTYAKSDTPLDFTSPTTAIPTRSAWRTPTSRLSQSTNRLQRVAHSVLSEKAFGIAMSGDKNRRYVSRNLTAGRTLLSSLYVCPGRN